MSDLFAAYGAANSRAKEPKPESALDRKMAAKQRLAKLYRCWRRDANRAVLQREPRLADFGRYLRTVQPADGDEMIDAIAESWLPGSSQDVRIYALRMVDGRCDKLNRQAGFEPLDDPLPPATNVYFRARALLHAGGKA